MLNYPLVSVVLAVYNGEVYLKDTIESVLNQSFKDFEFIIVNDCSTDTSESIILSYDDPRIVYLKNSRNLKLVDSLNRGISASRSDFIARIDADDIMSYDRLKIQYEFLNDHKNIGLLGSNVKIIDEHNNFISQWSFPNSNIELKKLLLKRNPFLHPAIMFKKDLLIEDSHFYDSKYPSCEDYELFIRLKDRTEFYSLSDELTFYRRHSDQITDRNIRKVQKDLFRLILNSVFSGKLSFQALFYLYKPLFFIVSPKFLINWHLESIKNKSIS